MTSTIRDYRTRIRAKGWRCGDAYLDGLWAVQVWNETESFAERDQDRAEAWRLAWERVKGHSRPGANTEA